MGTVNKSAGSKGQRTSTNQGAGKKHRTPTSSPHSGSRVEPSHETQHRREVLEKKAARPARKAKRASP